MTRQSIAGIYDSMHAAEDALAELDKSHFPLEKVSILAQNLESEKQVHGYVTMGDVATNSAVTGAWVGGLFGILIGAAFIWVPGFGPLMVAGPFAAALLGGLEGAVFGAAGGGLLGALFGWGVSKKHIVKYEESLRGGKYLLIIHGTPEEVEQAHAILTRTDALEINVHDVHDENDVHDMDEAQHEPAAQH